MAVAAKQHGVVGRRQLERAGISTDAVDRYIRIGRLRRLYRGVYQVGPVSGLHARLSAAILACGETAVVSHRTAAALWGMLGDGGDVVDVTVRDRTRSKAGIRVHRSQLQRGDITDRYGIPITTPARTLCDLASCVAGMRESNGPAERQDTERQDTERIVLRHGVARQLLRRDVERHLVRRDVERALAEALAQRLTTRRVMLALVARDSGRGIAILRELLESGVTPILTRSEAEERFLDLVRRGGVDDPAVNVLVERYEVDFLWRGERVIVEVDGRQYHGSRNSFESDRRRDAVLTAAGYTVLRVTWHQMTSEPEAILVRLVRTLCRATR